MLEGVDELLASGFGRNTSEVLEDGAVELGKLEKRADEDQIAIQ